MSESIRTLVTLDAAQKRWLERRSIARQVPAAQIVREALDRMRRAEEGSDGSKWSKLVESLKGAAPRTDGLDAQRRLREDWA